MSAGGERLTSTVLGAGQIQISDPANARLIYIGAGALALLGAMLAVATRWWWKSARTDHPVLAPLEVMGDRGYQYLNDHQREAALDDVRADGAAPKSSAADIVPLDLPSDDAETDVPADLFDDLRDEPSAGEGLTSAGVGEMRVVDVSAEVLQDAGFVPTDDQFGGWTQRSPVSTETAAANVVEVVSGPAGEQAEDFVREQDEQPVRRSIVVSTAPETAVPKVPMVRRVEPAADVDSTRLIDPLLGPRGDRH
jgi:hypothetical protein